MNNKKHFGFSLIELLVVIVIMGILATISVGTFSGFFSKSEDAKREAFVELVSNLIKSTDATKWDDTKYDYTGTTGRITSLLSANDVEMPPVTTGNGVDSFCYFYGFNNPDATGAKSPDDNQYFVASWSESEKKPIVAGTLIAVNAVKAVTTANLYDCNMTSAPFVVVGYTVKCLNCKEGMVLNP